MSQYSHVLCRVSGTDSGFIFPESHIEDPVKTILDMPVGSDRISNVGRIIIQRREKISTLDSHFFTHLAFRLHHRKSFQPFPRPVTGKCFDLIRRLETTNFNPSVPFVSRLPAIQGGIVG